MTATTKIKPLPNLRAGTITDGEGSMNIRIKPNLTYPYSDKFEYHTRIERINLDETRINDLKSGPHFIIGAPKGIKNDVKLQNGIFSNRFGSTISDVDSFSGKYRCKCGHTRGSIMHGEKCPICNTIVKYYDDDVSIFGWLVLKQKYYIIHPNLYRTLEGFIGAARLNRIIEPIIEVDSNGKEFEVVSTKKDEPFKGIGLFAFKERYDEILEFYRNKYPTKSIYYEDLKANKEIVFTHSIAVFSALLRPSVMDNGSLKYQSCNENYQMLSKLVYDCNNDSLRMNQKIKEKANLLYDIQFQYNAIYEELKEILNRKRGDIRSSIGGRYSFSSRSVIRQDPYLHCDEVKLPFQGLLELLQQVIINILVKTQNLTYSQAYKKWHKCQITGFDKSIYDIIDGLIKDSGGLPLLINRNPTISYGGILRCRCIGINMNYTMSISLLVLKSLAADFDGDTLNILYLYNKDFIKMTDDIFNPIQLYISRNTGDCNGDMLPSRDMLINANALKSIHSYTAADVAAIEACKHCEE